MMKALPQAALLILLLAAGCTEASEPANLPPKQDISETGNNPLLPVDTTDTQPDDSEPSTSSSAAGNQSDSKPQPVSPAEEPQGEGSNSDKAPTKNDPEVLETAAQPASISVLVNKQIKLPDNYKPSDLVYPDVPFIFEEKIEKRMMRQEAAEALETMFAAAKEDGVHLAGVSAYRSHATQKALFNRYVQKDGLEKARTYSALPGTSEHETGLAIDISGSDGKCAAQDCFGGTKEAEWLGANAHQYGFIVRYPQGKETITGYKYEPWHMRYVGKDLAEEIKEKDLTLEEYFNAVPVTVQ